MAVVLDVLADATATAKSGIDPDIELIDEIMRYMTVYPDAVHHPKEDILYSKMVARQPQLADDLANVAVDHQEIAALGTALRDDVDAIVAGAAVRREQFIVDCDKYVQRLRTHMQWEEKELFKKVSEVFDDDTEMPDVEPLLRIKDPVFELEIESAFRRLMASLENG